MSRRARAALLAAAALIPAPLAAEIEVVALDRVQSLAGEWRFRVGDRREWAGKGPTTRRFLSFAPGLRGCP